MLISELRHKMADAVNQANEILTREREVAEKEGRDVSPEALSKVDELTGQADNYKAQINEAEEKTRQTEERSNRINGLLSDLEKPAIARPNPIVGDGVQRNNPYASKQYRDAFFRYAQDGVYRDMLLSVPTNAGLLVAPTAVSDEIIKIAANYNSLHNLVTIKSVNGAVAYRVRKLTSYGDAPAFVANENDCIDGDDYTYAGQDLTPKLMPKLVKVSMTALAVSNDFESEITENLGQEYGDAEEYGTLVGSGSGNNMLGAFIASNNGIPTSRDIPTVNAQSIVYDDIMNMVWSLRTRYINSPKVGWVMSRAVAAVVSKIKDNEGRPLWQPSLAQGVPPTLSGIPVIISEFAPTALTTGSYAMVLGDWSRYYLVEYPGGFTIQRLIERYSECSEVGFIGRRWLTGAPVDVPAFSRLKLS